MIKVMITAHAKILQVRNRRHAAAIFVDGSSFEVIDCTNSTNCRIQGVNVRVTAPLWLMQEGMFRG
uniref:Uncharacterized protein n=1 Tax=Archaeoglobus fulgidus TaxID=2234 RepID=A0A7C2SP56_ARCFL